MGQNSTHIYVGVHVGNVGIRDGVKNNTKCNLIISEYSVLQMRWMKRWPHQEDTGMLNLALVHTPCYREGAHTQWSIQVTVHCALWFCDLYVHDVTLAWHQSLLMITLSHTVLNKSEYLDGSDLRTICVQILLVQHQFQITRETQTQTQAIHMYMQYVDQYCRYTYQKSERDEVKVY